MQAPISFIQISHHALCQRCKTNCSLISFVRKNRWDVRYRWYYGLENCTTWAQSRKAKGRCAQKNANSLLKVLYVLKRLLHSVGRFNICPSLNPKLACSWPFVSSAFKHPVIWVIELPILDLSHTPSDTHTQTGTHIYWGAAMLTNNTSIARNIEVSLWDSWWNHLTPLCGGWRNNPTEETTSMSKN